MQLEILPAKKGDCLMLHFGDTNAPRLAVIDGGPGGVYGKHLLPRLEEIRAERGLGEEDSLPIDLLMVSHIDDDHINGILALAREMDTARAEARPQAYKVRRLWHNSFEDLVATSIAHTRSAMTAAFGPASVGGAALYDLPIEHDAKMVLASLGQGHDLRGLAEALGWPINPTFKDRLVTASAAKVVTKMVEGVTLTVVGPLAPEIDALRAAYQEWLAEQAAKRKAGKAMPAAFSDRSVPNLSSIVVVVEDGKRRMLLTGDARGDKIMDGLKQAKLLPAKGKAHFDILKMPHHGSSRNIAPDFFERLHAETYVFSGDGEHGNPDRQTIEMLFAARPEGGYSLRFTYPIAAIDKERKKDAAKHGETFSPAKDALASLLAGNMPPGVSIHMQDGKPAII